MGRKVGAFEKRIHEVDLIRGILILIVILDHLFYFLKTNNLAWYDQTGAEFFNGIYRVTNFYWTSQTREVIRQIVLFFFVFISGVSCSFSRNNWKRAAKMIVVWGALSVVTNIGDRLFNGGIGGWIIDFNVIGVLAWSVLIYCFVQNCSWKGLTAAGLICFLITVLVIYPIPASIRNQIYLPSMWAPASLVRPAIEGAIGPKGDWMPLFPYICYFFMGAVAARFIYKDKKSLFKRHEWERWICFTGRNTIWVYLLHEPILLGIFALLGLIIVGA